MASIQIQWLGHSCFRVECQGYAVVLDPFEPGSVPGLRDIQQTADQVLCSHQHHDHNYRAGVALRQDGPANPFTITALPSWRMRPATKRCCPCSIPSSILRTHGVRRWP